jgi:hypothetical protein
MDRYAQMALDQHRRLRPLEHSLIDDPTPFFAEMGEQIQAQVTDLRDEILGPIRTHESIEHYRLRSYQALATAEEIVISDYFPSETAEDPDDGLTDLEDDPDLAGYYRDLAEINHTIHTAP